MIRRGPRAGTQGPEAKGNAMPSTTSNVAPDVDRHVRKTDPGTSREAAAGIDEGETLGGISALQRHILTILRNNGPLTDEGIYELYCALGYPRRSPQRVRTARSEMTLGSRHLLTPPRVRVAMTERAALRSGYSGRLFEDIPEDEVA